MKTVSKGEYPACACVNKRAEILRMVRTQDML